MKSSNCELLDPERGTFSVLGLVTLRLGGPCWWMANDLDSATASGSMFCALTSDGDDHGSSYVASVVVADTSLDPTEPCVSTIGEDSIGAVDASLCDGVNAEMNARGARLTEWLPSLLDKSSACQRLVSSYTAEYKQVETRYISLRFTARNHKIVVIGGFDVSQGDIAARAVADALCSTEVA